MSARRRPGRPVHPIPREHLLTAAVAVFDRDGYAAARLAEVAREAGISKGALAYHFPSKEALYLEAMAHIAGGFGALIQEAVAGEAPWVERLDALGEASVTLLGSHPHVGRLMLRELADVGPYASGPGAPVVDALLAAIVGFLDEGVATGVAARQDTRQLAGSIVALHLAWFGAPGLSGALLGDDPSGPDQIAARARAVRDQVRRLCGVAADLRGAGPRSPERGGPGGEGGGRSG